MRGLRPGAHRAPGHAERVRVQPPGSWAPRVRYSAAQTFFLGGRPGLGRDVFETSEIIFKF